MCVSGKEGAVPEPTKVDRTGRAAARQVSDCTSCVISSQNQTTYRHAKNETNSAPRLVCLTQLPMPSSAPMLRYTNPYLSNLSKKI